MQLNVKAIREIVYKEGNITIFNITKNMLRPHLFKEPPYTTGRTATSMHVDASIDSLIIYAPEHMDTLESGISPQRSKQQGNLALKLYQWSIDKPLDFLNGATQKRRMGWAMRQATKQNKIGSILYQRGGRKDIYSNEILPLQQRLTDRITNEIINTKIL